MKWIVGTSPDFLRDVDATVAWYQENMPDRVRDFLDALDAVEETLNDNPLLHRARNGNWHAIQVPGFTYTVWYLVNENSHQVYKSGVLHQSRNPSIIAKRTHTRLR
jgi:hypothetical protein